MDYFYKSALFLIIISLAGCAVGPNFRTPTAPDVSHYGFLPAPEKTAETPSHLGESQAFLYCEDLPEKWWNLFHSEELNQLICLALEQSPTIASAEAKLFAAIENASAQRSSWFFPQVDLNGSATQYGLTSSSLKTASSSTSTTSPNASPGIGSLFTNAPHLLGIYSAFANVSYNLDLFGLEKRKTESLYADADFQNYELYAAKLTLVSNIATTAFKEASFRAQIVVTKEMLAIYESQIAIMERQLSLGGIALLDLTVQKRELAITKAPLPSLETNFEQARSQLAIYSGRLPSDAQIPEFYLDSFQLPTEIPLSIPSELVRQRPDILASEAKLHKANADFGVATANLFPQINLTGSYGPFLLNVQDFLRVDALLWSIGASLSQPVFHGGELLSRRRSALEELRAALAEYRQTILQGFQNVADSLKALESDATALQQYAAATCEAETALRITQKQYMAGGINYLNLLDAEREYQQTRLNLVQAQAARLADTAVLFHALGGGWNKCGGSIDRH